MKDSKAPESALRRVAVTGMGIISCIGNDVQTFKKNLFDGVCGIESITEFETDILPVKIGGKIKDFKPEDYGMDKPFIRKQDPFTLFAMAAAYQAMNDSGLKSGENIDPFRLGTYVGSGIGGFQTIQRELEKFKDDPSGQWISPNFIPTMISDIAGGQIAIKHGAKGSCIDIVTACATSTHSLGEAFRAIRHGYSDAIIAGGTDHCTIPIGLAGFANARALTRESDPKRACLPFNAERGGFVMADGAAILVLEEMEHAIARGAHIYAEMTGYGSTCDAYHATAPRPDATTQAECIRLALEQSGFDSSRDNVYINAHGTGTPLNDKAETIAIKKALGEEAAQRALVSSTKSMTGHMLDAAGAAEAVACVLALQEGAIPPTINLLDQDPECDLNCVPNRAVRWQADLAVSNSLGFGGHNACLAFRKA